jgi:predicted membrane chloride channel (bestrophin family)
MAGVMVYTFFISFLENEVLHFLPIKNPLAIHSLVGFILSLLLVFRTNSSYDRWWEGRKIWGSFTNNSRNLALKLNAFLPEKHESREIFRVLIGSGIFTFSCVWLCSIRILRINVSCTSHLYISIFLQIKLIHKFVL